MELSFKEWLTEAEGDALDRVGGDRLRFWRYGNYCGPGPKLSKTCDRLANGEAMPAPKNAVDDACRIHDQEYCRCGVDWRAGFLGLRGTLCSRDADDRLVARLNKVKPSSMGEKIAANLISKYFRTHVDYQNRYDAEKQAASASVRNSPEI